ncbi:uncharacterized protein B0I36DRAFT_361646 [Microdochium trichocladiopsis]|uniref:FAD-binding domain-containing protein n=1 Tax=Microdochium trichocladiopsis TaxID=1682393 RepID=A0A9P8Y826_9PEZI|nr:uncharacterized protein B0I36DRAFT_361646 [Microdochium trichocladiopsis]KAH7032899.1 hypothetical protein B0I36DRAFT_361646 [Microdochium trichocladiopsis]
MSSSIASQRDGKQLPVLIIGAGSCGLALANGLKNAGIPYRIFEREAPGTLRHGRDWALACHWAAPMLEQLVGPDRWPHVLKAQADPTLPVPGADYVKILDGATGETVNEFPFHGIYRFLRSKLRAFLAEPVVVEHGKTLVRFDINDKSADQSGTSSSSNTVTAIFDDGTAVEGRLLVGADGSKSLVRGSLLLSSPQASRNNRLPFAATFIAASYTREQALFLRSYHPLFNVVLHPHGMVGMLALLDAPDPDKPEDWVFQFYISWASSPEEQDAEAAQQGMATKKARWEQVMAKSAVYGQPLRSAFDWLQERMQDGQGDDSVGVFYGGVSNWDPSAEGHVWDNRGGLVTLVGDAAHPMTYHRGQGLNHAIADAAELCKLLSSSSSSATAAAAGEGGSQQQQKELIDAYEAEMRTRAGEEVRLSEMNTRMLHDWDKVQHSPLVKKGVVQARAEEDESK